MVPLCFCDQRISCGRRLPLDRRFNCRPSLLATQRSSLLLDIERKAIRAPSGAILTAAEFIDATDVARKWISSQSISLLAFAAAIRTAEIACRRAPAVH